MNMAQNIMRVNSINDRYMTETMIGLNLNLNEEIDFDFFDDIQKPCEELLGKEKAPESNAQSEPCISYSDNDDDDDDVQVSPQVSFDESINNESVSHLTTVTAQIEHNISPHYAEQSSTNVENEDNLTDSFIGDVAPRNSDDPSSPGSMEDWHEGPDSWSPSSNTFKLNKSLLLAIEIPQDDSVSIMADNDSEIIDKNLDNSLERPAELLKAPKSPSKCSISETLPTSTQDAALFGDASVDSEKCLTSEAALNCLLPTEEYEDTDCLPLVEGAMSVQTSETQESEASDDILDSDEGCMLEGSDEEELLLAVHTLTIIPRGRDGMTSNNDENLSDLYDDMRNTGGQCDIAREQANVTARSSSGYSSASCKTHGCTVPKNATNSKAKIRHSSPVNSSSPDMDEFIKSFGPLHPASVAVSFASGLKYSSKSPARKRSRKNMSFTKDEMQRIERENAILLNKIVLQQRPRPPNMRNYERRICSNAINRARQLKRIEYDNEILLRKIQDVKRRNPSCSSSRCTSQASSSHF